MADLALKHGLTFADLYAREGLVRLDAAFVAWLRGADVELHNRLMAGRADLVCLARPHLANPYWMLHAAADANERSVAWPKPYWPGRDQMVRLKSRPDVMTGKV